NESLYFVEVEVEDRDTAQHPSPETSLNIESPSVVAPEYRIHFAAESKDNSV
ncbi:hypothetical protein SK128_025393, partial [Halocaridina rubra]